MYERIFAGLGHRLSEEQAQLAQKLGDTFPSINEASEIGNLALKASSLERFQEAIETLRQTQEECFLMEGREDFSSARAEILRSRCRQKLAEWGEPIGES